MMSQHRKLYHDKVHKMKRRMLVATKKIMSRKFSEAKVYEELGATILCRNKNKIAGSKLCRDIIKVYRDRIQEKDQRTCRDRKM